jgi:hypothetical protein
MEDGGTTLLRNTGISRADYTMPQLGMLTLVETSERIFLGGKSYKSLQPLQEALCVLSIVPTNMVMLRKYELTGYWVNFKVIRIGISGNHSKKFIA